MGLRVPLKGTRGFHGGVGFMGSRREQGFKGIKDPRT